MNEYLTLLPETGEISWDAWKAACSLAGLHPRGLHMAARKVNRVVRTTEEGRMVFLSRK